MSQKTMIAMLEEAEDVLRRAGCDMTADKVRKVLPSSRPSRACGDSFTSDAVCANCLAAQQQAEPVAWFYSDNFDKQDNLYRRTTVRDVAEGFARQGRRIIAQYDTAQPLAVAGAVPQDATEGCGACGDGCKGQGCRLERESPPTCQTCNGQGMVGGLLPNGGGYDGEPCPDCNTPKAADPIKRLIAMHNELLGEYPYCYFELAYTRRTDWMAWLCTKPREDDPERKVLACGQGLTAEEACAEAISAAQKGGEA